MNCPDYNSPSALKAFMDQNGMAMQKKFGQNFMVNPKARADIISMLEPEEGAAVWEVGPGLGAMTSLLLSSGLSVTAFEIDRGFIAQLHTIFADEESAGRFRIVEGDVLKTWRQQGQDSASGIKLFGNLPYNIAATLIADTITKGFLFDKCVFTVQKEVADRMRANPSEKDYSSFSVLCQWRYDVKPGVELAPGNFWPRPAVASQAVSFTPKRTPYECSNPQLFVNLVHVLFSQRRKTVRNNIKPLLPPGLSAEDFFSGTGIVPSERAENLALEDFLRLTDSLNKAVSEEKR